MCHPDGMSRRMRTVQSRPTKESRKAERQKVGSLSSLVVQPKTKNRYAESFRKFCEFHELAESFPLPEFHTFDEWVADYVEQLWEEGSPKSDASMHWRPYSFSGPRPRIT